MVAPPDGEPAKVLIVDDHPLVREGIAARIAAQPDMQVCGEASTVEEALELLGSAEPALMIVDLVLKEGHGLDLIKKVHGSGADTRILVLSAYDETLYSERVLRAGAHGYLQKDEAQVSVVEAARVVLAGQRYLGNALKEHLLEQSLQSRSDRTGVESLSDRELEVFERIGRGNGTGAIARHMNLSVHTVDSHRARIRAKLGLRDGTELARHAVQWVLENG